MISSGWKKRCRHFHLAKKYIWKTVGLENIFLNHDNILRIKKIFTVVLSEGMTDQTLCTRFLIQVMLICNSAKSTKCL